MTNRRNEDEEEIRKIIRSNSRRKRERQRKV